MRRVHDETKIIHIYCDHTDGAERVYTITTRGNNTHHIRHLRDGRVSRIGLYDGVVATDGQKEKKKIGSLN